MSSLFESSFDYQSLLPTRRTSSSQQESLLDETSSSNDNNNEAACSCLPELSYRERILGCVTCMIAGYLLSMGSFWRIKDLLLHHDPLPFVLNATVGNIVALAGSFFLSGPSNQLARMWHPKRQTATALYLSSLGLTVLVAFLPRFPLQGLILLLLMLSQYVSITWYTLSYVPFAHDAIRNFVTRRLSGGGGGEY